MNSSSFEKLLADAREAESNKKLPPVHDWSPPFSGDIDIVIKANGTWVHEGEVIERDTLVNLFASILRKEADEYFLVTPVEKWRIQVEDVPFLVTALEVVSLEGEQGLVFKTRHGDTVVADKEHPLKVLKDKNSGEVIPYLLIRDDMEGRLNRSVYYQLAELAESREISGEEQYGVSSVNEFFILS